MSLKYAIESKKQGFKKVEYFKTYNNESSKTRQEFTKDCDINRIVSKYLKTGVLENERGTGIYSDVSGLPDYASALQFVVHAKESFRNLNPVVRKRFHNNPNELLEFLRDESNYDEALKLGLVNKPDVVQPPEPPSEPSPEPSGDAE